MTSRRLPRDDCLCAGNQIRRAGRALAEPVATHAVRAGCGAGALPVDARRAGCPLRDCTVQLVIVSALQQCHYVGVRGAGLGLACSVVCLSARSTYSVAHLILRLHGVSFRSARATLSLPVTHALCLCSEQRQILVWRAGDHSAPLGPPARRELGASCVAGHALGQQRLPRGLPAQLPGLPAPRHLQVCLKCRDWCLSLNARSAACTAQAAAAMAWLAARLAAEGRCR